MGVLSYWRMLTGTPPDAVTSWRCPRCDEQVELTGFGQRAPGQPPIYRPTVMHLVRVCRCAARGVAAVPEWPARARRPGASVWLRWP